MRPQLGKQGHFQIFLSFHKKYKNIKLSQTKTVHEK